jgi:DNA-binding response OmpR family regulator
LVTPAPTSARILIVEDDRATCETFARILRVAGYDVRTARTAGTALLEVDTNRPDAIVLDLKMPLLLHGVGFLQRLRERPEMKAVPVAVVTGDLFLDKEIQAQLVDLGATLRFKPLHLDELTRLVRKMISESTR